MLSLDLQTSAKKSFFGSSFSSSVRAILTAEGGAVIPVRELSAALLAEERSVLAAGSATFQLDEIPRESSRSAAAGGESNKPLVNLRGRPPVSLSLFGAGRQSLCTNDEEELLYIAGSILSLPQSLDDWRGADSLSGDRFSWGLKTRFAEYAGRSAVRHAVSGGGNSVLTEVLGGEPLGHFSLLVPVAIEEVRVGYEKYEPHDFGSMLGRLPKVRGRFFLEISAERICLLSEEEGLADKSALPNAGSLKRLSASLAELQLHGDLRARLHAALSGANGN